MRHVPVFLKRAVNADAKITRVPKKPQVSAEERSLRDAEIISLYREGKRVLALAYHFGMSTQNIFRLLKVYKVRVKNPVRRRYLGLTRGTPAPTVPQCLCTSGQISFSCPFTVASRIEDALQSKVGRTKDEEPTVS